MKKYSFLVYHKEYIDFLNGIRDLGVLHVIEKESGEIENDEVREKYQLLSEYTSAIKFLSRRMLEKEEGAAISKKDGKTIVEDLEKLRSDQEDYNQKLAHFQKEHATLEPWGEFSWETIEKLEEAGYKVDFFSCPIRDFEEEWNDQYEIFIMNEDSGFKQFIIVHKPGEDLAIDAEKMVLPKDSLTLLKKKISDTETLIEKTEVIYDRMAVEELPVLEKVKTKLESELSFDKVVLSTDKQAEDKVMFLEGWVPEENEESVNNFLAQRGVYYEVANPEEKDAPPIKLKNSKFARLFESIGELYTFPEYKELDLTPFFAPFYMLFFGFCLGDAGYGLLITIGALIGMRKVKPNLKPLMKLGMFLGIATTVMGIIGGTYFGIMLHPDDFGDSSGLAPWIQTYQQYILSSDNLMYLALGLGYFQVLFGMFLNAANRIKIHGFKYALSQLGWNIIVLITIPAAGLMIMELIPADLAKKIMIISGVVGGIPAFFYNTPGKNPLLNLGVGLWDTYQVASGLLGDVLSYIRLFALGLSSAILGNVFNSLALQAGSGFGDGIGGKIIGGIVILVILAFGHGLNFFMAALGSFVHPLRLTFVEFYKNAGFSGGGRKYQPFKSN